jgi:hypothetical protein
MVSYAASAKPTVHISLAGIEDLLGSNGEVAQSDKGFTKYFSTWLT